MSARVYLFADFGKGPRVVRSVPAGHAEVARMVARGNRGDALAENWDKSPAPWWLVECESAEHGRRIISAFVCGWPRNDHEYGKDCWVLANGGAK